MKKVLVDSSVWIGFFKGIDQANELNMLIDKNLLCINDLILSEILPSLIVRRENELVDILNSIEKIELRIDWIGITQMQIQNIKNGINKVGIPDLIIAQNAIQNDTKLFSLDKHFGLMKKAIGLKMFL
jgi:predicted nucleic acid-binding protein